MPYLLPGRQLSGHWPLEHSQWRTQEGPGRAFTEGLAPSILSSVKTSCSSLGLLLESVPQHLLSTGYYVKSQLSQGPGDPFNYLGYSGRPTCCFKANKPQTLLIHRHGFHRHGVLWFWPVMGLLTPCLLGFLKQWLCQLQTSYPPYLPAM